MLESAVEELRELVAAYPLPAGWLYPTLAAQTTAVRGVAIHVVGLTTVDMSGQVVTGSAGQLTGSPVARAYFELVERVSVMSLLKELRPSRRCECFDTRGVRKGSLLPPAVFPDSADASRWQYARSNGVAVGRTWGEACRHAQWELIERDRVLRSWYAEIQPNHVGLPAGVLPGELSDEYAFEVYSFRQASEVEPAAEETPTAGVFGFPRCEGAPFTYGLGARDTLEEAILVAARECIQRLGFLWGEKIPRVEPRWEPRPRGAGNGGLRRSLEVVSAPVGGATVQAAGMALGSLELLDELGRGAHSIVYRARSTDGYYAVKLPLEDDPRAKHKVLAERFRREATRLARIRHPALPAVMGFGEADGVPYILMELVTGETLSERLQRAPLSEAQAVELGRQLADALERIHASGLVHCDITPENIRFEPGSALVRLVGFGFAMEASAGLGFTAAAAGTRAYAAPEQFSAGRTRIDGRADLYSLGCVLCECVLGRPLFRETDVGRELNPLCAGAIGLLDTIAPGVSADFAALVARLLEPDPDHRYGSAGLLLEDLDRLHRCRPLRPSDDERRVLYARGFEPSPLQVPLVGRTAELQALRRAWIDAGLGPGGVVVLEGPLGVGKSRLAHCLASEIAAAGRVVLAAICGAEGNSPFSAVRQLIEAYVDDSSRFPDGVGRGRIRRIRQLAGDLSPLLAALSPRLGSVFGGCGRFPSSGNAPEVFVEGIGQFLSRLLAETMPATIMIDNVQWLDAASQRVIKRVLDRAATTRAFFMFVGHSDTAERPSNEGLARRLPVDGMQRVELEPLGEPHLSELVRAYLGDERLDGTIVRYVTGLSNGLPMCVLDVLRALLDGGVLVPEWGRWKLDQESASRLELPNGALRVLAHRVAALDPSAQQTLLTAAVIGDVFDDDLLLESNGLQPGHTLAALADARRAMLVQSMAHGRHRFVHQSVRETLLGSLPSEELRHIHQHIAEALDARPLLHRALQSFSDLGPGTSLPPLDPEKQFALATHYARGVPGHTPERVFETNCSAGEVALFLGDDGRALEFWTAAQQAADSIGIELRPEFELNLAEAELRSGSWQWALERCERLAHVLDSPERVRHRPGLECTRARVCRTARKAPGELAAKARFEPRGLASLADPPPTRRGRSGGPQSARRALLALSSGMAPGSAVGRSGTHGGGRPG